VMTAVELGYRGITCLNFCQPGYTDETTARKIARSLNLELVFYSMAGGNYLLDLEKNLSYNQGQILLHGAAHLYAAISSLDLSGYGILHSGQLGDGLLGSFLHVPQHEAPDLRAGYYSDLLLDTFAGSIKHLEQEYPTLELHLLYNKGFNAVMNGEYACAEYSYSISPFLEPDFAQFCLNIDPALRLNYHCYQEWVKRCNPRGAEFPWERTGANLYTPYLLATLSRKVRKGVRLVVNRLKRQPDSWGMNPFDFWLQTNPTLRGFIQSYSARLEELSPHLSPELKADTLSLLQSGNTGEKLQAVSLLAGLRYLLSD
jgi:asparagine synthase (glutamine-hydrolysing)